MVSIYSIVYSIVDKYIRQIIMYRLEKLTLCLVAIDPVRSDVLND